MELMNQVCSLELAKELKNLGVKQDSLWYWVNYSGGAELILENNINEIMLKSKDTYSAFTVAEFGKKLPNMIRKDNLKWYQLNISLGSEINIKYIKTEQGHNLIQGGQGFNIMYMHIDNYGSGYKLYEVVDLNESNTRAKMLIYLIKNKYMCIDRN